MIAKLSGVLDSIKPTEIVLNVNGVGYQLFIPFSTFEKISSMKQVDLHVYTLHREDQFRLYGFFSEREKELFSILIDISGIGPSMALSLLSGISIERFLEAVQSENYDLLVKIPGIGKSKAEKLVFELKRRIKKLEKFYSEVQKVPSAKNDAIDALTALGFDDKQSGRTVTEICNKNPDMSVESIIKEALKRFSM